jgi:predicted dienelactone hydrolase
MNRTFVTRLLILVSVTTGCAAFAQPPIGYRQVQWHDDERDRDVWCDVWYPASAPAEEAPIAYGLGRGKAARDAALIDGGDRLPLVAMSHGAMGSARDYSWIAEHLARNGYIVLGVSHAGESWIYGADKADPAAVLRLWERPLDCAFAIDRIVEDAALGSRVDTDRIAALGHSSGGVTAIMLGGATFDPPAIGAYCASRESEGDRGCEYFRAVDVPDAPPAASASYRDERVRAIVALDPAAGPGFSERSLENVTVPVFVAGSKDNDFLPYLHHAGRFAAFLPEVQLESLENGEGHFVYLDECTSPLQANGVPLCHDREGVDRGVVHAFLSERIVAFLDAALDRSAR